MVYASPITVSQTRGRPDQGVAERADKNAGMTNMSPACCLWRRTLCGLLLAGSVARSPVEDLFVRHDALSEQLSLLVLCPCRRLPVSSSRLLPSNLLLSLEMYQYLGELFSTAHHVHRYACNMGDTNI